LLGEHTDAVLARLLALTPQELTSLESANVSGKKPLGV
jgi:hypothetical protein